MADIDNSIDKIEIDGKNYNVSIAPNGILDTTSSDKFVSSDINDTEVTDSLKYDTTVGKIVETETHNTIFSKLTSMIKNIRILNKLVNRVATTGKTGLVKIGTGISVDSSGTISVNTNALKTTLLNMIYPVGSIYLTIGNTNPGSTLGGTWEPLAAGYVLATYNATSGVQRYGTKVGATTGKDKITLSTSQLPAHHHAGQSSAYKLKATGTHKHGASSDEQTITISSSDHKHTYTKTTANGIYVTSAKDSDSDHYRIGTRGGTFKLAGFSDSSPSSQSTNTGNAGSFEVSKKHKHKITIDDKELSLDVTGYTADTGSGSEIDVRPYTYAVYAWRRKN